VAFPLLSALLHMEATNHARTLSLSSPLLFYLYPFPNFSMNQVVNEDGDTRAKSRCRKHAGMSRSLALHILAWATSGRRRRLSPVLRAGAPSAMTQPTTAFCSLQVTDITLTNVPFHNYYIPLSSSTETSNAQYYTLNITI
jgi:hypothetical protein